MNERIQRIVRNPNRIPVALLSRIARISGVSIPLDVRLTTGGRMRVKLPETVSVSVAYDGDFEPDVTAMMRLALSDQHFPVFYDIGAHFGLRSIQAHNMRNGRVRIVAFEPHPDTMTELLYNVSRLSFPPGFGIVCEQQAIGSHLGMVEMTNFSRQYCGSNTLYQPRLPEDVIQSQPQERLLVPQTTLDTYVRQGGPVPTFMKLDIENGEKEALSGADDVLRKYHPGIAMEAGDKGRSYANSTSRCLNLLRGHGYTFFRVDMASGQLEQVRLAEFSGGRGATIHCGQDNVMCVYQR